MRSGDTTEMDFFFFSICWSKGLGAWGFDCSISERRPAAALWRSQTVWSGAEITQARRLNLISMPCVFTQHSCSRCFVLNQICQIWDFWIIWFETFFFGMSLFSFFLSWFWLWVYCYGYYHFYFVFKNAIGQIRNGRRKRHFARQFFWTIVLFGFEFVCYWRVLYSFEDPSSWVQALCWTVLRIFVIWKSEKSCYITIFALILSSWRFRRLCFMRFVGWNGTCGQLFF